MDTMNFLISAFLMMIAIQLQQPWIAVGIVAISILTAKELSTVIMFLVSSVVLYFAIGAGDESFILVAIFAVIIISIIFGAKTEENAPQGGGYGDMLGGLGGY